MCRPRYSKPALNWKALFLDHPASVGETYWRHLVAALSFSGALFRAGIAGTVHALVPGLCVRTASGIVSSLHKRMVTDRSTQTNNPTDKGVPS